MAFSFGLTKETVYGILIDEKGTQLNMFSKKIKIVLAVILVVFIIIVIRRNVTITKEPVGIPTDNTSMQLEVNSETVKGVYDKLTLLEGGLFDDEVYDNMYFNMEEDSKELSTDEKLYLVFENLYRENLFSIESVPEENSEVLKVNLQTVKDKYESVYKEEFNPEEIEYNTSSKRGIISMFLEDDEYILKLKKNDTSIIKKAKIVSATKTGDYINLKIKAFYATKTSSQEGNEPIYKIKNYGENRIIAKEVVSKLNDGDVFENKNIYSYTFSFELAGDDYYLRTIKRDIN